MYSDWLIGIGAIVATLIALWPAIHMIYRAFFERDYEHYDIDE